ncbi:MAG: GNAT family N-acetyltransferase [Pseudomonadota bacterium]
MTARPSRPPARLPSGVQVVRAQAPTVAFYRFVYHEVGNQWIWTDRKRMSDAALKAVIEDPRIEIETLWVDGVPAGFAELDYRRRPQMELAYFGLMTPFIGRGLGRIFLEWVIDRAWQRPISRLDVHTCTLDHPSALANYKRRGFAAYRTVEEMW